MNSKERAYCRLGFIGLLWVVPLLLAACRPHPKDEPTPPERTSPTTQGAEWSSYNSPLANLPRMQDYENARSTSYDKSGKNSDYYEIPPWSAITLDEIQGPACITRVWMALNNDTNYYLKKLVFRVYWDDEKDPSIEVPIGDFFGNGFGEYTHYISLAMSVKYYWGLNCYLPMPFEKNARFEVSNETDQPVKAVFFHFDYCKLKSLPSDMGRLHAWWNSTMPCQTENYTVLDTKADGQYVGCFLHVRTNEKGWFGEGDDFMYIDDPTKPTILGTGSEDYFGGAWMFNKDFPDAYSGCFFLENNGDISRTSMFRFHLEAPIRFRKSFRFDFERFRPDDFCSTAFWYQNEPHAEKPRLTPVLYRLPRGATIKLPNAYDFEKLQPADATSPIQFDRIDRKPNSLPMHDGTRIVVHAKAPGESIAFQTPSVKSGLYNVRVYLGSGPNGATLQFAVDGKDCGTPFEGYAAQEGIGAIPTLSGLQLDEQPHKLEIKVTGKQAQSKGYDLYLDCIELLPVKK